MYIDAEDRLVNVITRISNDLKWILIGLVVIALTLLGILGVLVVGVV